MSQVQILPESPICVILIPKAFEIRRVSTHGSRVTRTTSAVTVSIAAYLHGLSSDTVTSGQLTGQGRLGFSYASIQSHLAPWFVLPFLFLVSQLNHLSLVRCPGNRKTYSVTRRTHPRGICRGLPIEAAIVVRRKATCLQLNV